MDYGMWSKPGVPHIGWNCAGVEDLGAPVETCAMCEKTAIRYVHVMEHADWPFGSLRCGCVCAGNMEGDVSAARGRETVLAKKARFARSKAWRCVAGKGISYGYFPGGLFAQVETTKGGKHMLTVKNRRGAEIHRSLWPTELRAKGRVWEGLQKKVQEPPLKS